MAFRGNFIKLQHASYQSNQVVKVRTCIITLDYGLQFIRSSLSASQLDGSIDRSIGTIATILAYEDSKEKKTYSGLLKEVCQSDVESSEEIEN